MSLSSIIIFGCGAAGPLVRGSMDKAAQYGLDVSYEVMDIHFADLAKPLPTVWRKIRERLNGHDDAHVVFARDALILWDHLDRALVVNHRPDFLWPMSLTLDNTTITPRDTQLFKVVGGFEMSLFHFADLGTFHHVCAARALMKLLTVANLDTMTIGDYLSLMWLNFESVKAPDTWILHAPNEDMALDKVRGNLNFKTLDFARHHTQRQMGREALDVQTRNTLTASEFVRSTES